MASDADFLTTQKNGVVAINAITNQTTYFAGNNTSAALTSQTLIATGSGYLVNFSVTVAGTTVGTVNNAVSTAAAAASNALVGTPNTIGVYSAGVRFTSGLVVTPGTGQSVVVTYSLD